MARLLLIGDPHLRITRFDLACQFLEWVNNLAIQLKPDGVVNLGDTFDTHCVVRSEIMGEFYEHLNKITETLDIPYYYVLGNHDFYKPTDSKYHVLQSMVDHPNLVVIDKRTDIRNITFVPYLPDHSKFPIDTKEICIAHQTFVGADYGYMRPEVGVDAAKVAAEIIISGHIHIRQQFGKVIYPGTPYAQSINDIDQSKGVMLFDTDTYKVEFFECPLPSWRSLKYEVNGSSTIYDIHEDIKQNINGSHHWVVTLSGPRVEVNAYQNSEEFADISKNFDVRLVPKYTDSEKKLAKIEAVSMERIITEYVDKIYSGSIDKMLLKEKALSTLNKVKLIGSKQKM